jgi:predicted MFS family arabinose efflux permease
MLNAFLCAAALGVVAAVFVFLTPEPSEPAKPIAKKVDEPAPPATDGWRLLLSTPILANLVFFILLSMSGGGLYNYLVVTLGMLHGTPVAVANTALTGLLIMSAVGVLVGGMLTGATSRYGLVTAVGLLCTATACLLVGLIDFPALILIALMSSVGTSRLTMPSRDADRTRCDAARALWTGVRRSPAIAGIVSPLIRAVARSRLSARDLLLHGILRADSDRHRDLPDHAQAGRFDL